MNVQICIPLTMRTFYLLVLLFFIYDGAQGARFRLSARNIPSKVTAFVQINEGTSSHCRTNSIEHVQNPSWGFVEPKGATSCSSGSASVINMEVRNDINGDDKHIGWVRVQTKRLPEPGKTITEEIWENSDWKGTMRITGV